MTTDVTSATKSREAHPTQDMPVVFVVDDDISVRQSLELLISSAGWSARCFDSAGEFLGHPSPPVPKCVLLDLNLPDLNGLEVQARVSAAHDDTPIVFMSAAGDIPTTVHAMRAGALEFLTKPFAEAAVLKAVDEAIVRSRERLSAARELNALTSLYESLSRREREVMQLVVSGLLNKQVAWELGISEITVKAHRGNVMRKMQAHSLAQLVTMADRLGLGSRPGIR